MTSDKKYPTFSFYTNGEHKTFVKLSAYEEEQARLKDMVESYRAKLLKLGVDPDATE